MGDERLQPDFATRTPNYLETGAKESRLHAYFGRREFAGFALRTKAVASVSTVTERFIFGQTATTKRDYGSSTEAVVVSFRVSNSELAFDAEGAIIHNGNFRRHATRW